MPDAAAAAPPATGPGEDGEPRKLGTPFLVLQFFLFPMAIVAVCVGVFVVFGLIAGEGRGARDYLDEIRRGGANRRWQAAFELSKVLQSGKDKALADPRFVPEVMEVYEASASDDPRVRRYLTLALGRLRDPRALPVLSRVARGEGGSPDAETQIYAVLALGSIGDPAALPALLPLAGSSDAGLRKAVAHALGSLPSEEARRALGTALHDQVEDVRWNAALALARRGDAAAAPVLLTMMDRAHMNAVPGLAEPQREEIMLEAVRAAAVVPDP
ncbi:MAG TPA: HEAT repeat domain-containing protein, partial [Vicinamibacteria bacterium]|nr:HEAT repeat domain-containing protein [Vicinamibacteria bacterium]